jgi:hypothetical protein
MRFFKEFCLKKRMDTALSALKSFNVQAQRTRSEKESKQLHALRACALNALLSEPKPRVNTALAHLNYKFLSVTAPCEAVLASLANLASTPVV